ncbi:divalent metal cation (Fe/Co/Zn/Cd) transporter [Variovorax paradoxus]|uniref:Divalent metal cation (Fe/Co/Zn/Cd) transporter n=1 Tax=Variovorax paradoxus TaxID=34073 RepID=A0AAE3XVM7_VARPD|nr:hypothetical protein [Variovorax paradoxus]MDR6425709.1 divalent metal cation (Fe/Co/Zn/Cd) transporter [Variovorax paradoxus]
MLYTTALMIHAGATLAALLSFVAGELLLAIARKGRSQPARMALRAGRLAHLLLNLGVLAGIALVFLGGWPLWTPWLLAAFAVIAAAMVVRSEFVAPWESRVESALGGKASDEQVGAFASERSAFVGRVSVIALFGVVAALMTMKPSFALLAGG